MTTYGLPISCLSCGAATDLMQSVSHSGSESISLLACTACRRQWSVAAQMRPVLQPESYRRRDYRAVVPV